MHKPLRTRIEPAAFGPLAVLCSAAMRSPVKRRYGLFTTHAVPVGQTLGQTLSRVDHGTGQRNGTAVTEVFECGTVSEGYFRSFQPAVFNPWTWCQQIFDPVSLNWFGGRLHLRTQSPFRDWNRRSSRLQHDLCSDLTSVVLVEADVGSVPSP